jgi:hypothetical protein
MEAWIGVITSFCLIIGCFGMIVVLFFWDETIVYCCTQYVHLHEEVEVSFNTEENEEENEEENDEENEMEEDNHLQVVSENEEEEDDTEQNNHVILQVGSGDDKIQAAQATTKRFLSSDSYTLRFAQV